MGILDNIVNATCESCRWWESVTPSLGECHRRSPLGHPNPDNSGATYLSKWPQTYAYENCGDWDRLLEALQP